MGGNLGVHGVGLGRWGGGSLEWPVAAKEIFTSFELLSVLFAEFLRSPLGFISRSIVTQPLFFFSFLFSFTFL